jgi:hypothetical protein
LVATFYIVYSVVAVAELLVLAAIHPCLIHPVEPKWLHHVDPVVALVQAVEPKWLHHADQDVQQLQAADQAVVLKLLRAIPATLLQAAELKARAADLADRFFQTSKLNYAV